MSINHERLNQLQTQISKLNELSKRLEELEGVIKGSSSDRVVRLTIGEDYNKTIIHTTFSLVEECYKIELKNIKTKMASLAQEICDFKL